LRIVEEEYGAGRLVPNIDYLLEWVRDGSVGTSFRIAPATLASRDVTAPSVRFSPPVNQDW